jgi:hypothetical protein
MTYRLWTTSTILLLLSAALHAQPEPGTPEALFASARQAAGLDHAGTYRRICGVPDNRYGAPIRPPGRRPIPDRDTW